MPPYQTQAYVCQFVTYSQLWVSIECKMHKYTIILTTTFWNNYRVYLPHQMYTLTAKYLPIRNVKLKKCIFLGLKILDMFLRHNSKYEKHPSWWRWKCSKMSQNSSITLHSATGSSWTAYKANSCNPHSN